ARRGVHRAIRQSLHRRRTRLHRRCDRARPDAFGADPRAAHRFTQGAAAEPALARQHPAVIQLEPWTEHDLPLLARLNAPEMTEHLGGPETAQQLEERHKRYVVAAASGIVREVDKPYTAYIYKVVVQPEGVPVGNVVFWDREWNSEQVYEMGWGILPEHQGRGIATAA